MHDDPERCLRAVQSVSEAWRPWRAYTVQHLWATGDHAVNRHSA